MTDVGDAVPLRVQPLDDDRNPVDVAGIGLVITRPDGTTTPTLIPTRVELGSYTYTYTPTQAGRHVARWAGPGFADTYTFNVWPADPRYMFNSDDARKSIGETGDEDQLRLYIAATTCVIEDIVGPVIPVAKTETFPGGTVAVLLQDGNVNVTAVTQDGATLTPDSYTVSAEAGVVYAGLRDSDTTFASGPLTVQYTTGLPQIPANVLLAGIEELRFLWQQGQQGNRPGFSNDPDTSDYTPSGFAVPRRVIELCGNDRRKAWRPA